MCKTMAPLCLVGNGQENGSITMQGSGFVALGFIAWYGFREWIVRTILV